MFQIRRAWVAEARTLAGISLSIAVTMFAQLAISAVETLIIARVGVHVLAGVTLALSVYLLMFLFALGVVTAVTPIVAQAHGRGDLARIIHEKCAIKAKPLISLTTMRMGCLMKFFAMKFLAQVFGGLGRFRAVR